MSLIKRIAVHVDGGSRDGAVLRLALALAAQHGAEAEAVFARIPPFIPASVDGILTPQIVEAQQSIYAQRAEAARKTLEEASQSAAVKPAFAAVEGPALEVMIARARFADLAVIGQPSPEESDAVTDFDLPAELVMELGRPVLVVPNKGDFATVGKRVLVARAGTRESRRAATDALALLDAGSKITVLMVNPQADNAATQADMKGWYARHGHAVEIRVVRSSEKEVGDVLRATAAEIGADLVVMGAYGRSRLRELILGGATHSMLKHTAVPVLMSH
jgi:nucleotide-binding universal stress UspA family protein